MNNNRKSYKVMICFSMALVLMTVLVSGCIKQEPSVATGVVSNITMSEGVDKNNRPINPKTVFPVDAPGFYCSFMLYGFPVGTTLEAQWIYVGGDPYSENITGKNYVAETQTATIVKEGRGYTATVYARPSISGYKWPIGDYKVVINVGGMEKATTYFKVE